MTISNSLFQLQSLLERQFEDENSLSHLEKAVKDLLQGQPVDSIDWLDHCRWKESAASTNKTIDNWKLLLAYNFLGYFFKKDIPERALLIKSFERYPWNSQSQYFRVISGLNHFLVNLPTLDVHPILLDSGAALIELEEYSPWQSLPYTPQHAEFGIFLSALAFLTGDQSLVDASCRLALWQLNTLDSDFHPFESLYAQENSVVAHEYIVLLYLLFHFASELSPKPEFFTAKQALGRQLNELPVDNAWKINPLWLLLDKLLPLEGAREKNTQSLPSLINDPCTSLVGVRSIDQSVLCTLHGGRTGLGYFRSQDIKVVNFGPQYAPLDNCQGFGIEGNIYSEKGLRKSTISQSETKFHLSGCVRVVDQPTTVPFNIGGFKGIWFEIEQKYSQPTLQISTKFLGIDGWEDLLFCFYVKAQKCRIGEQLLFPKTFQRYIGTAQEISFIGEGSELQLNAPNSTTALEVIPLGGGESFWGGDFLVAYRLIPEISHYQWTLSS